MATAIGVIIVLLIGLVIIGKLVNSIQKSVQKIRGKARYEACNSRLKAVSGKYATMRRKCGLRQSLA